MKKTLPYISVIIPAHNEELYLSACLKALSKQKGAPTYEVIVVDNNSTDQTASIARSFGVRIVREKQKGASAARNRGASVARATLLVFIDADCVVPNNHLKTIWESFASDTSLDALGGPYFYHDGGPFQRWLTDDVNSQSRLHRFYKKLFGLQTFISANFSIKKHVYLTTGGFDERIDNVIQAEDAEFACRLAKRGHRVVFDPTLRILSSARRYKQAFAAVIFTRTFYVWTYLINTKMAMLLETIGHSRPS